MVTDVVGRVGQIELDRPPATRLEVDEERTGPGREQIAWMGFTVQKLLRSAALADRASRPQAARQPMGLTSKA
ncbi:hypothetical protein AB0K20_30555 [Micromonospora matsumotoense]|uniref:hypothetical protein n=1 Tax=Micromonospora matsumotoense TaxID=121616 RepID=UPI0034283950